MRYRLEKLGCYILIIVLLPYIVTVFLNGPVVLSQANVEEMMVRVKSEVTSGVDMNDTGDSKTYISVPLTDYAIGILAREIPASYEIEAIKAQAIMVRTKIYKEIQENGSDYVFTEEFFTQSDMEEAWGITKYAGYYNKLENAWKETEGQVLMYDGELIYTPFFSLSNGSTRDGAEVLGKEYPYLKIKDCPLDIEATEQLQTMTVDMELSEQKQESGKLPIEVISLDTAGYVLKVRVGEEAVNGEEFRRNYNLASSCFSIHEYEGKLRITTRGVGHGIGLSQNTANKMAGNGKLAQEILEYFYEGCEIKEVADMVVSAG